MRVKGNIFVTGGAGYIGSHACKMLRHAGFNPIAIDCLNTGNLNAVKYGPFENINLLDKIELNNTFLKYRPTAVMHFAALSQVAESCENPGLYWRNNVQGSLNLIECCVENNCFDLIFSSTCSVYGDNGGSLLNEGSKTNPINPYSISKKAVEDMIQNFSDVSPLRFMIFRYFNVAGADAEAEIGEQHSPETHLIPLALDAAAGRIKALTIYGNNYNTPDGTCIRDFIHVSDLIEAHILGLKSLKSGGKSGTYNLGSGVGFSVLDVIKQTEFVTRKKIDLIIAERRSGDAEKLVSGSSKFEREFNWKANYSTLPKMIEDAWRWHQKLYR